MSETQPKKISKADHIRSFSERLITLQEPIRILESVRWSDEIRDQFLRHKGKVMPKVNQAWYQTRPLGFDPPTLKHDLSQLKNDIGEKLGINHPAGAILLRMCREYDGVVSMLQNRGRPEFGKISKTLFGSSKEVLGDSQSTLADFGRSVQFVLDRVKPCFQSEDTEQKNHAEVKTYAPSSLRFLRRYANQKGVVMRIILILSVIFLYGCGSNNHYVKPSGLSQEKVATLHFYRTNVKFHSLNPEKPFFYINKQLVTKLGTGQAKTIEVQAGEHRVSVKEPIAFMPAYESDAFIYTFEGGKYYYIRYSKDFGGVSIYGSIVAIDGTNSFSITTKDNYLNRK